MYVGDDGKQVVPLHEKNQVVREKPHLPRSKCTMFCGSSELVCFLLKRGATSFLNLFPWKLNWKVTPQEIEFDLFQNKKI